MNLKTLTLALALLLLLGCREDIEKPIESDIEVEVLQTNGKTQIIVETLEDYPDSGYEIIYTKRHFGKSITISFRHIKDHGGGFGALMPASATIDLGNLEDEEFDIRFKLNGVTTKGSLIINPLHIDLEEGKNVNVKK